MIFLLHFLNFLLNSDDGRRVLSSCLVKFSTVLQGETAALSAAPRAFKSSEESEGKLHREGNHLYRRSEESPSFKLVICLCSYI